MAIYNICGPSDRAEGVLRYVNAYEVTRQYGGPEEGGWYYDEGTPVASMPVTTAKDEEAVLAIMRSVLEPQYKGRRGRHSVIGEEDLLVRVEEHMATAWPQERPRYE